MPVIFLTGLAFAAMGLIVCALAPSYDFLHVLLHALHHADAAGLRGVLPADQLPAACMPWRRGCR
jgi:hypothetical protein